MPSALTAHAPPQRTRGARARAWLRAARPHSQVNIALPIALGVGAAVGEGSALEPWMLLVAAAFSFLDQLFIVFANDYADRHTDGPARTLVSGGSGVLVDGSLTPGELRRAALLQLVGLLLLALVVSPRRPGLLVASLAAVALMQLYSYPPARLSHRGGGEWLQGLGVGVVLPWVGYYLVSGSARAPLGVLVPMLLFGVSGNVATAMPDVDTDRAAGKRTLPVSLGERSARLVSVSLFLAAMALAAWLCRGLLTPRAQLAMAAAALPLLGHLVFRARLAFALIQGGAMSAWLVVFTTSLWAGG